MKKATRYTRITFAALAMLSLAGLAQAGNERICSPMLQSTEAYIKFPNGAFSIAGDYGSDRITSRYDNDSGQRVLLTGRYTNVAGGGGTASNKLCHIDQARSVGAPSTLIMVFGNGSDCNNWYAWAQVQSEVAYSGCDVSGNTVTLK